ncbi:hypothetical protein IQ07DRAFT_471320, partial [Pyrenochaeta sp. DS3sAY3a]
IRPYLTLAEEIQIYEQFHGKRWKPNGQVLWSGLSREEAQRWADEHGMQTLTTAMGPLLDSSSPMYARHGKSTKAWKKYIKGASAMFAWTITERERVLVLSPPPPERFHPSGQTTFQRIEEPIIKGAIRGHAVLRIDIIHPIVKGAEDFSYQLWPID